MSGVIALAAALWALLALGWVCGSLMERGNVRRKVSQAYEDGFDAGYERARGRYSAVQQGMTSVRVRRGVKLHDPRENRETGGLWS